MKITIKRKALTIICALCICSLLIACKYALPEEKRVETVESIAEIVRENFDNPNSDKPLDISMAEIGNLADADSDLKKAIDKYADVQDYNVYLLHDNKVLIVTENLGLGLNGYVVSDEELKGALSVPGSGFDGELVRIINRVDHSNLYYFSAGQ